MLKPLFIREFFLNIISHYRKSRVAENLDAKGVLMILECTHTSFYSRLRVATKILKTTYFSLGIKWYYSLLQINWITSFSTLISFAICIVKLTFF